MIEYLALPYSHKSERVMVERAAISDFIFSELSKEGRIIYAPISSCHYVARTHSMPTDWRFWGKMGKTFVEASDRVLVIPLPGWEKSVGLIAEMKIAIAAGIDIEFLDLRYYMNEFGKARRAKRNGS